MDQICFGDLDGDGIHEIIVGWGNSYNTLNALSIYQYQNGKIVSIEVDYHYSSIAVADFGKNGEDEIFISTLNDVSEDVIADAKDVYKRQIQSNREKVMASKQKLEDQKEELDRLQQEDVYKRQLWLWVFSRLRSCSWNTSTPKLARYNRLRCV